MQKWKFLRHFVKGTLVFVPPIVALNVVIFGFPMSTGFGSCELACSG